MLVRLRVMHNRLPLLLPRPAPELSMMSAAGLRRGDTGVVEVAGEGSPCASCFNKSSPECSCRCSSAAFSFCMSMFPLRGLRVWLDIRSRRVTKAGWRAWGRGEACVCVGAQKNWGREGEGKVKTPTGESGCKFAVKKSHGHLARWITSMAFVH